MNFEFIKYTQPAWQFNLMPHAKNNFPACFMKEDEAELYHLDERYQSRSAKLNDLAYRLWNKGYLLYATKGAIDKQQQLQKPSLHDEYTFLRKYWGSSWALFALLLRLFSFKNSFKEVSAFLNTKAVKKINVYDAPFNYKDFDLYQSSLVEQQPFISIIIPTLNRYNYLDDALKDLEQQLYQNFEVIIIDQSDEYNENFYSNFNLDIKVIRQREKLLWTARNKAIAASQAKYLLFFDDDSRVTADWILQHVKCIDYFKADISAGVSLLNAKQKIPESYSYFRWADQFDSGNALVKRSVFEAIGLFDEQFNGQRMGDGEFGIRVYINGFKSISNHKAARVHLKVDIGGLREMGGWDGFRPKKLISPKPLPSVTYMYKKYFPKALANKALLIGIILSNVPFRFKKSNKAFALSMLLTVIKSPLLLLQFLWSKKIAARMLKQIGIKFLNTQPTKAAAH